VQLREKQKAKYTYGVLEKQFRNLFEKAATANCPGFTAYEGMFTTSPSTVMCL